MSPPPQQVQFRIDVVNHQEHNVETIHYKGNHTPDDQYTKLYQKIKGTILKCKMKSCKMKIIKKSDMHLEYGQNKPGTGVNFSQCILSRYPRTDELLLVYPS